MSSQFVPRTAALNRAIESYVSMYYRRLRQLLVEYEKLSLTFPTFLKGKKKVVAYSGSDGVAIVHCPSDLDSFEYKAVDGPIQRALADDGQSPGLVMSGSMAPDQGLTIAEMSISDATDPSQVIWRAPWDKLETYGVFKAGTLGAQQGEAQANGDILSFVAAKLMAVESEVRDHPDIVVAKLSEAIEGFQRLLRQNPPEEPVQRFLSANPVLLEPKAVNITPKLPLGSEYVTDFVIEMPDSNFILVELEAPGGSLYTKKGDPAAALTHAQRQVEDWRNWVFENSSYAQHSMPGINDPHCWIVIGRRETLTGSTRKALRRKNSELHHIKIMNYDDLIDLAKSHRDNLRKFGRATS